MNVRFRDDAPHLRLTDEALAAAKGGDRGLGLVVPWPDDGMAIGLYERCRCVNTRGLLFNDCCRLFATADSAPIDSGVGVFLGYSELWPSDPLSVEDTHRLLARFDPQDLIQTLSRISAKLQDDNTTPNSKEELGVLKLFLAPDWFDKVRRWLTTQKRTKAIHRVLLTSVMIQSLARSGEATSEIRTEGNRGLIGELLIKFNQLIEDDYQVFRAKAQSKPEEMRVLYASLYRQAFYAHVVEYPGALGRTWALIKNGLSDAASKGFGTGFDFEGEFRRAFGFDLEDMFTYGFALVSHYSVNDNEDLFKDPSKFVTNRSSLQTIVPPELLETSRRIFDYLTLTYGEHAAEARKNLKRATPGNMYQLFSFYDHPLIEMPTGIVFALDTHFLRARVTEGVYWALFNKLPDTGKTALRDAFGHALESYAASMLRESFAPDAPKSLWLDWDGDFETKGNGVKKPDAVIREGDTLFFVELTTSAVTPQDACSGDHARLEKAIKRIWFGEKPDDSAKLSQLAGAMADFREGRLMIPGVLPEEIAHIRPILVSLRDVPHWPVMMNWYRDLMREGGRDAPMTEKFIEDVVLVDIEELEEMAFRLLCGETWTSLLNQKRLARHGDISMHNFMCATERTKERHPFVARAIETAADAFKPRMN